MVEEQTVSIDWISETKHTPSRDEDVGEVEVTNSPGLEETGSIFGDTECGEPLLEQRIKIDFAPDDIEDNEFAQKKCCEFWTFIHSLPHLQRFMVYPEKPQDEVPEITLSSSESSGTDETEKAIIQDKTALSTLELIQERGYINRTFETKMPQSTCTLGSREYKESEAPQYEERKDNRSSFERLLAAECGLGPCCPFPGCPCKIVPKKAPPRRLSPLRAMIKNMDDWDSKHPKSMEPPGHPPSLQHCILQRVPH